MSGRAVAVVGFGVTGRAVARARLAAGDTVAVFDDAISPHSLAAADAMGIEVETTPAPDELARRLRGMSMVVPSPGVPVSHPVYRAAEIAGVRVCSEIELGYEMCAAAGRPALVAITGTNGKTTVTTLVTAILQASGVNALAAGNIGVPLIEAAATDAEVCVAEVSSFQLQFTDRFRPSVSCWLNLSPDHLDWHPTLEHYARAKARIWRNQGPGDTAVINADDPLVASVAGSVPAGVALERFHTEGDGTGYRVVSRSGVASLVAPDGTELVDAADLPRSLPHDLSNCLAAAAVALAAGATVDGCRAALTSAPLLPHRVSLVGSAGGVSWYDDSKATTPASVLAAVAGFDSVVLICGGRNKGLDLGVLAATVPRVRAVVAIGESAQEVLAAFSGLVPSATARSMDEAVEAASMLAEPGDAVILSPGCASFDWYTSYAARGDHFASIVASRLSGVPGGEG